MFEDTKLQALARFIVTMAAIILGVGVISSLGDGLTLTKTLGLFLSLAGLGIFQVRPLRNYHRRLKAFFAETNCTPGQWVGLQSEETFKRVEDVSVERAVLLTGREPNWVNVIGDLKTDGFTRIMLGYDDASTIIFEVQGDKIFPPRTEQHRALASAAGVPVIVPALRATDK